MKQSVTMLGQIMNYKCPHCGHWACKMRWVTLETFTDKEPDVIFQFVCDACHMMCSVYMSDVCSELSPMMASEYFDKHVVKTEQEKRGKHV